MVNLYKLLNVLEQGMSLFQLNKWKTEGIWYPITQYKKESDDIQVVTNLFIPEQKESHMLSKVWLKTNIHNPDSLDKPFIQLSATFTSEFDIQEYNEWLRANQYKLYPLLLDILKISLKDVYYNYSNTSNIHYEGGKFPSMLTIQLFNLEF